MRESVDVTEEYLKSANAGTGNIILQSGYYTKNHVKEIQMAEWLRDHFGGDITLLAENGAGYEERTADYLWNSRFWELKTLSSETSIDSALKKAIRQIRYNPGGVLFQFEKAEIQLAKCEKIIFNRINTSCRFHMDIVLLVQGKLLKVLRY